MSYIDKLHTLAKSAAKSLEDNEKLVVPVVFAKLKKCASAYPHDPTILGIANVFSKFPENKILINKGEFKDLYNKFYSSSTKFASLFEEELGAKNNMVNQVEAPKLYDRQQEDLPDLNPYESADPMLATALSNVFDKNAPIKVYSNKLAAKSLETVSTKLNDCGLKPTTTQVIDGNSKFIVVQANYETPKGVTSILIPTEIVNDKVVDPDLFIGNKVLSDINYNNIKNYIKVNAGSKLHVNSDTVIAALSKTSSDKEVSGIELAAIKVNASKNSSSEFSFNNIVGQQLDELPVEDLQLPKASSFSEFEEKFATEEGLAQLKFGKKLTLGKEIVARELSSFGYKTAKINVQKVFDNKVVLGVSLNSNKVAFTVPVSMEKVEIPSRLVCDGEVMDFSQESIATLQSQNLSDGKVASALSPQYGLKPSELINNIKIAMLNNNKAAAEDALNILQQSGDDKAYLTGFKVFASALSNPITKEESKCCLQIKTSASSHLICGHTHLPVNKVYQDKYGNCKPLYRKGMDETYEAGYFMNSKIFG